MTSPLTRLMFLPVLSLPVLAATSGCVVVGDSPPPPRDFYGDISFLWSFDGLGDCDAAAVDELDIAVFQDGALIDEINGEPCVGGGLTLLDYFEGRYELEIDAYARNDDLLYSGGFTTRVTGGAITDAGIITLDYYGDDRQPPPAATGSVAFFWAFAYPTDEPTIACDVAGVRDIDVRLTSPGLADVTQSFDCSEDGAIFDNLPTGSWTLHLDGYGSYHNDDIHLYEGSFPFTVVGDIDLEFDGDLVLSRDEDNFADIDVRWGFNGTSCAAEGIGSIRVDIARDGLDAEATTTVDCVDLGKLVSTFVPGSYTVTATGAGRASTWTGAVRIDLAPDTVGEAPLQLAPR